MLISEKPEHHFCHILLVKQVTRGDGLFFHLWIIKTAKTLLALILPLESWDSMCREHSLPAAPDFIPSLCNHGVEWAWQWHNARNSLCPESTNHCHPNISFNLSLCAGQGGVFLGFSKVRSHKSRSCKPNLVYMFSMKMAFIYICVHIIYMCVCIYMHVCINIHTHTYVNMLNIDLFNWHIKNRAMPYIIQKMWREIRRYNEYSAQQELPGIDGLMSSLNGADTLICPHHLYISQAMAR